MDLGLKGLKAAVTGSTRGIGKAIAETLAAEGCDVAICARNEAPIPEAVAALKAKGVNATGAAVDVADGDALKGWITASADELGGLDILVCNVSAMANMPTDEAWKTSFDVDIMGTVHAVEAAKPKLIASDHGSIVAVGTVSTVDARDSNAYGPMKAALLTYVGGISVELGKQGVRANTVTPGPVYFEGGSWENIKNNVPKMYESVLRRCPSGRMSSPQDIANTVVFLSSPAASHVSGTNVIVDGAFSTRVQF